MDIDSIPIIDPAPLRDRVAIVTGSGSQGGLGTGQAIAGLLGRAGARVVVNDIDEAAGGATLDWLAGAGIKAELVIGDVSKAETCRAVAQKAVGSFGRIDVLVNNVGITGPSGDVVKLDEKQWDRIMSVNVKSIVLMSKHCVPHMESAGGVIVNISSIGARLATDRPAYTASKGAINSLTLSLAGQHGKQGIRVNAVAPGMVWTPLIERETPDSEIAGRLRENRRLAGLLPVEGNPWDVARAVLFLASDQARWITGQVLTVDAGALSVRAHGTTLADLKPPL